MCGCPEDVLRALRYMLRALSQLDTELGYCQGKLCTCCRHERRPVTATTAGAGLNFVAAMALKEVGEETGFWVCTHLMEEAQLRMLYLSQVPHLSLYIGAFEECVRSGSWVLGLAVCRAWPCSSPSTCAQVCQSSRSGCARTLGAARVPWLSLRCGGSS